jgi:hypothetical protein
LGSHTDVRGSDAYNLQLAQARADAAVTFLKSRGIAPQRIIARGYGEQQLTNACADGVTCTEEGHQENRRTEITVLGFKDPIYSLARSVEDIWGTAPIMIPSTAETAGPFTILVGTYLQPQRPSHFATLAGTDFGSTAMGTTPATRRPPPTWSRCGSVGLPVRAYWRCHLLRFLIQRARLRPV